MSGGHSWVECLGRSDWQRDQTWSAARLGCRLLRAAHNLSTQAGRAGTCRWAADPAARYFDCVYRRPLKGARPRFVPMRWSN